MSISGASGLGPGNKSNAPQPAPSNAADLQKMAPIHKKKTSTTALPTGAPKATKQSADNSTKVSNPTTQAAAPPKRPMTKKRSPKAATSPPKKLAEM